MDFVKVLGKEKGQNEKTNIPLSMGRTDRKGFYPVNHKALQSQKVIVIQRGIPDRISVR